MNERLKKVNDYLTSVTGHVNQASDRKKEIILPENFKEENLSKSDKHTMIELKNALDKISNIESIADSRAKKIEKGLSLTGLNLKKNV